MPDYLLVFRKDGENPRPVAQRPEHFPLDQWQEWASPVWMTVDQTRVLNAKSARSEKDERHLCPLQLDVIDRALTLWSNPGDTVLSPFAGIGSEGYCSLRLKRRFIGVELKDSYFKQAIQNLDSEDRQHGMFEAGA
jgi:DNA modification methylase